MRAAKRHRIYVPPFFEKAPKPAICVSTPGQRVLNHLRQGRQARYTYLTQRSSGVSRDGWTDHPPVPASTVEQAVPILLFDSMVVHDTSHKPFHFLTQLNCTEARHRTPVETLFNNTVLLTHAPFRSLTFLPNVVTESLKTNVRVCASKTKKNTLTVCAAPKMTP